MEIFTDCTKRGAQNATKLYSRENVQGTRVCRNDDCLLLLHIQLSKEVTSS